MNGNGLLSNRDVASRSDINANYFRRVRDGTSVIDPLTRAHAFGVFQLVDGALQIGNSLNLQTFSRTGPGEYTLGMASGFVSDRYAVLVSIDNNFPVQSSVGSLINYVIVSSTQFRIFVRNTDGTLTDPAGFAFSLYGIAPDPSQPNQSEAVLATNGLFTSKDLAATGQVESNYYVRKNQVASSSFNAVKAFAFVSSAIPGGVITIANSLNIESIVQANFPNAFRVKLLNPLPGGISYSIVATVARNPVGGGTAPESLIIRSGRISASEFFLVITRTNSTNFVWPNPTAFYLAVFQNS